MSTALKLHISDEMAARIDSARGLLSRQEFIVCAVAGALDGSCVERELRAQVERLMQALEGRRNTMPDVPVSSDQLSW